MKGNNARGEGVFLGSATPRIISSGAQRLRNFGTSYMCAHGMRNSSQIFKLDERKNFTGLTTFPALAKLFCDTNADARSVCSS